MHKVCVHVCKYLTVQRNTKKIKPQNYKKTIDLKNNIKKINLSVIYFIYELDKKIVITL